MIKISFLGSGNAFNHLGLGYQSIFLQHVDKEGKSWQLLLDCGPTAIQGLIKEGMDPNDIQAVFLTHFHGDHAAGLPFLLLYRKYMSRSRVADLHVFGGKGLRSRVLLYLDACYPTLKDWVSEEATIVFHEIKEESTQSLSSLPLFLEAIPIPHEKESLGYRIHLDNKIISISGDTKPTPILSRLARDASIFIVECSTMTPIPADHVSWEWIKDQLPSWNATWIILNHYAEDVWNSHEDITKSDPRIILAQDGLKLVLK